MIPTALLQLSIAWKSVKKLHVYLSCRDPQAIMFVCALAWVTHSQKKVFLPPVTTHKVDMTSWAQVDSVCNLHSTEKVLMACWYSTWRPFYLNHHKRAPNTDFEIPWSLFCWRSIALPISFWSEEGCNLTFWMLEYFSLKVNISFASSLSGMPVVFGSRSIIEILCQLSVCWALRMFAHVFVEWAALQRESCWIPTAVNGRVSCELFKAALFRGLPCSVMLPHVNLFLL